MIVHDALRGPGLVGRRALIVGAGYRPERAGHGRAIARTLAAAGARVACADIDPGRAAGIVEDLAGRGGEAFAVVGDVTAPDQARRVVGEAALTMGGLDVVVDVVGEATWAETVDITDDAWLAALTVNLSQVFYVFREAARLMIPQASGGALLSIASVDGIASSPLHAPYGAAKAGLIHLTKSLSTEWGPHGLRVNAVAPGNVGGGQPDGGVVEYGVNHINPLAAPRAQDVADTALYLCSDLAERVTGQCLVVDGGATTRSPWDFTSDDIPMLQQVLPPAR